MIFGMAELTKDLPPTNVGKRVTFGPPLDVKKTGGKALKGKIEEELWADFVETTEWGDYAFCSQRIKWDDGHNSIRLAYYRRRVGSITWEPAFQHTIECNCDTMKNLMERTLSQTTWFSGC